MKRDEDIQQKAVVEFLQMMRAPYIASYIRNFPGSTKEDADDAIMPWKFTATAQSTPAVKRVGSKWTTNWGTLSRLKSTGVRRGFPDLCVMVPYKEMNKHGRLCFIEMKKIDGVPSDIGAAQHTWGKIIRASAIHHAFCFGAPEAIGFIMAVHQGKPWAGKVSSFNGIDCDG